MLEVGKVDFELREEIGTEGRNSRVFVAEDKQLDAEIVVKQIEKDDFDDPDEYFAEAKRLYDARHPNVVQVKYGCRTEDHIYIAMPHYSGGSVHGRLERRQLTVREIIRYGLAFLNGLHHVHTRGLIHFDVKPSNVLIDASDRAALSDFGLSRHVDDQGLAEQDVMYRLHRPPESLQYSKMSADSDIYQAGLTLYRMATGLGVLEDQWTRAGGDWRRAIVVGELPDRQAQSYPAHIPQRLRTLIRTALKVDPDDRFSTALEMGNALANVQKWLDWQYSRDPSSNEEKWIKFDDTHKRVVTLREDGDSYEVKVYIRRLRDGHKRRSRKRSGKEGTRAQAHKRVRDTLSDY